MNARRFPAAVVVFCSLLMAAPGLAQVEVTVEELDVAGNPPGLEGMPGMLLTNQDTGTEHLVVFGGCTEDDLWDQALVLSDVSNGFDDLTWTTVPVPGMGAACEHIVAGPGDVGYLIGGFRNTFDNLREMTSILEIRLTGTKSSPVIETTEITVDCADCPVARVGHAATWLDEFEGCDGGGVFLTGGNDEQWSELDDAWFYCSSSTQLKNGGFHAFPVANLINTASDHPQFRDAEGRLWVLISTGPYTTQLHWYEETEGKWWPVQVSGLPMPALRGELVCPSGADRNKVLVFGGWDLVAGSLNPYVYEIDLVQHTIRTVPSDGDTSIVNALAYIIGWRFSPKSGGVPMGLFFGGVTDYSPRTLSNKTFLVNTTSAAPIAHYAVPAVARVQGSGAFFTSVMHLLNGGTAPLELEMTLTPREGSGGQVKTVSHTVPAGVMQTVEDPIASIFGHSGSAGRVGSILVTVTSGSPADLMLQTVVFAELDTGERYGQFFPALALSDAIGSGDTVYLNTTEDPSRNRVNVGLMAAADGTRFRVRPVDPLGSGLAPWRNHDLDTGGNTQINNIHSTFGLGTMADVVIEVKVTSGKGFAYASVLDGSGSYDGTSDPTTIQPTTGGKSKVTLLEIGSIQGLNEFSGSASITNYSDRSANVRAEFYQRGHAGPTATETLSIPAGDTIGYSDLGAELFGVSGDVGSVVLAATNNTRIGATGREFAIFRNGAAVVGTAGQLIAGQANSERLEPGDTYAFIGLRQTRGGGAKERSHFAVFNPGTSDAEVTVELFDGASGASEGERSWIVPAGTLIQVNNVIKEINSGYDNREKWIEVEVDQKVFMNAFRVNEWGDPVTLNAFAK